MFTEYILKIGGSDIRHMYASFTAQHEDGCLLGCSAAFSASLFDALLYRFVFVNFFLNLWYACSVSGNFVLLSFP
jgi:hypothetical protein